MQSQFGPRGSPTHERSDPTSQRRPGHPCSDVAPCFGVAEVANPVSRMRCLPLQEEILSEGAGEILSAPETRGGMMRGRLAGTRYPRLRGRAGAVAGLASMIAHRRGLAAHCNDEGSSPQCSTDQHFRGCGTAHLIMAGLRRWRDLGITAGRQELDQTIRVRPRVSLCKTSAGQALKQRSQSARCCIPGQLRQLGCLLPGIYVQPRQGRENAEGHFISVGSDQGIEEIAEFGPVERNRNSWSHDNHRSCRVAPGKIAALRDCSSAGGGGEGSRCVRPPNLQSKTCLARKTRLLIVPAGQPVIPAASS